MVEAKTQLLWLETTIKTTRRQNSVEIEAYLKPCWVLASTKSENIAKLGDGLDESPTVMVGDNNKTRQLGKNRGILKPSWAFVETKSEKRGKPTFQEGRDVKMDT
jgi:hypothetical protein